MLELIIAVIYILYTATVCFICAKCNRWWCKILVTVGGLGGLSLLVPLSIKLAELLSSLLSLAISVGVYVLLIVIFISCMFPKRRHR